MIRIYILATGVWFLHDTNSGGVANLAFVYGPARAVPLLGPG